MPSLLKLPVIVLPAFVVKEPPSSSFWLLLYVHLSPLMVSTMLLNLLSQLIIYMWLQADSIFYYMKQEPEVTELAYLFLKITAIGLPAFAINEIMKYLDRFVFLLIVLISSSHDRRYLSSQGGVIPPTCYRIFLTIMLGLTSVQTSVLTVVALLGVTGKQVCLKDCYFMESNRSDFLSLRPPFQL
jgi:hypothetical protein